MTEKSNDPNNTSTTNIGPVRFEDQSLDDLIGIINGLIESVENTSKECKKEQAGTPGEGSGGGGGGGSGEGDGEPGLCDTLRRMVSCGGDGTAESDAEIAKAPGESASAKSSTVGSGGGEGGADGERAGLCGKLQRIVPCGGDSGSGSSNTEIAKVPGKSAKSATDGSGGGEAVPVGERPGLCGKLQRIVPCGGDGGAESSREKAESPSEGVKSTTVGGGGSEAVPVGERPGLCGKLQRIVPCGGDGGGEISSREKAELPSKGAKSSTAGSGGGGSEGVADGELGLCGTLWRMVPCGGGAGSNTEIAKVPGESAKSSNVGSGGGEGGAVGEPRLCGKLRRIVPCGGDGGAKGSTKKAELPGGKDDSDGTKDKGKSADGGATSGSGNSGGGEGWRKEMDKLQSSLEQIKTGLELLVEFEKAFPLMFKQGNEDIEQLLDFLDSNKDKLSDDGGLMVKRLREINTDLRRLKNRIPSSKDERVRATAAAPGGSSVEAGSSAAKTVDELLELEAIESFKNSSFYNDVKRIYGELELNDKKCLLCFSLFAENELVKNRMLTYWWIGERYLTTENNGSQKKAVDKILGRLVEKGLIEPVYKKKWAEAKRYRMTAIHRSAIVHLAEEEKFFIFDEHGNLAAKYTEKGKETAEAKNSKAAGEKQNLNNRRWLNKWSDEDQLETIFNANEKFPDLRLEKLAKEKNLSTIEEWLSEMKNLTVLYLGSWRTSGKHHIEVESTEFLKGLKKMSSLRLFSLQGISRISALTKSISGLVNLEILDLKSCHNLEEIPDEIRFLKKLTHLDVSNCYLIDHMPKGLGKLRNLQVLKGFVVGPNKMSKFCTLDDLKSMKELTKLSIIINNKEFPTETDLAALRQLEMLQNLTLSWGAADSTAQPEKKPDQSKLVLKKLTKLDLQCYPEATSPHWLSPQNLVKLEKLYIRGGNFQDDLRLLGEWSLVQTLRSKYLKAMKTSWGEIQKLFPKLMYLEKVDCPMITLCPCDEEGVWVKESSTSGGA